MNKITVIGLDLAKNTFHLVGCDQHLKIVRKRVLRRHQVLPYIANLPRCCIGLEACASAHYWGRQLESVGFEVKLIPPQYVKPYVRGNKNDYNDALAIAEAATRGEMRIVPIKSTEQQDVQALHRLRARSIAGRTALCNQLRGLLAEYGLVLPQGIAVLRAKLPVILDDPENGLSPMLRRLLWQGLTQLRELDTHIAAYTAEVKRYAQASEACRRLRSIPGYGEVVSSAYAGALGNGRGFHRGRDVAASLGLVPRQHSTGGKEKLLGISKRGDRYLRSLLIHGARAVVRQAAHKDDRLSQWINQVRARRGFNKAVVAYANKMARVGWAILTQQSEYQSV